MKISIDTVSDSKEDIRKAIRLLQSLVEHEAAQGSRNLFDSPSADLFGSAPAQASPASSAEPAANPLAAFGSMFGDDAPAQPAASVELPKKRADLPQVEFY